MTGEHDHVSCTNCLSRRLLICKLFTFENFCCTQQIFKQVADCRSRAWICTIKQNLKHLLTVLICKDSLKEGLDKWSFGSSAYIFFKDLNHDIDKFFYSWVVETTCKNIKCCLLSDLDTLLSHFGWDSIHILIKLSHWLQNRLQEVKELLTVNVILKCKLSIVLKYLLEDLTWCFIVNDFSVWNQFVVLFCFFIKVEVLMLRGLLIWNNYLYWFLLSTLVE